MSVLGGAECVLCVGCTRWAWRRLTYSGSDDSASWPPAAASDFAPVPRVCRAILAAARSPSHDDDRRRAPPYILSSDPASREVLLAVRGLDLARTADYGILLDDGPGMQALDGGYVHRGLLRAAVWLLHREASTIGRLVGELGEGCRLVFAGHSLGSGVAALMTVVAVNNLGLFGGVERSRVRCYAIAPARCMSLNLAVKYADVIHSVILQDDFLPRTPTPLQYIFGSIFCLPCLLCLLCMRDTFISEDKKLKDPRRLYAPGRMYHIVERKVCRCGTFPPEVRNAIPVEGRFEHVVLSCNAMDDHYIVSIEREAQKALDRMGKITEVEAPPSLQKMEREMSLKEEHRDAMEKTALVFPPAVVPVEQFTLQGGSILTSAEQDEASHRMAAVPSTDTNLDELVQRLFEADELL